MKIIAESPRGLWGLEIGDWATWVGALGTFLAFGVVVIQLWRERKYRIQEKAMKKEEILRAQAVSISIWRVEGRVTLRNASLFPIYDAVIALIGRDEVGIASLEDTIKNTSEKSNLFSFIPVVPPGSWDPELSEDIGEVWGVEIAFRDSSGNTWIRRHDGALSPFTDLTAPYADLTYRSWSPGELTALET